MKHTARRLISVALIAVLFCGTVGLTRSFAMTYNAFTAKTSLTKAELVAALNDTALKTEIANSMAQAAVNDYGGSLADAKVAYTAVAPYLVATEAYFILLTQQMQGTTTDLSFATYFSAMNSFLEKYDEQADQIEAYKEAGNYAAMTSLCKTISSAVVQALVDRGILNAADVSGLIEGGGEETCILRFFPNIGVSGVAQPADKTISFGKAIGDLPIPVKEGYTFDGWEGMIGGVWKKADPTSVFQIGDSNKTDDGYFVYLNATWTKHQANIELTLQSSFNHKSTIPVSWGSVRFEHPATDYDPDLALISSIIAADANNKDLTVNEIKKLGFTDVRMYDNHGENDNHSVLEYIGSQKMNINGQDTMVVLVDIRGTEGTDEWISDFTIGSGGIHTGFGNAELKVYDQLQYFMQHLMPNNLLPRKYLITGHSRGAAVANLLAFDIINKMRLNKEDVYAYTFATPNVADKNKTPDVLSTTKYNNIFNFVNPQDTIPYVPLADWGYAKFGRTIRLPSNGENNNAFKSAFKTYTGKDYTTFEEGEAGRVYMVSLFKWCFPTKADYLKYETSIASLAGKELGKTGEVFQKLDWIALIKILTNDLFGDLKLKAASILINIGDHVKGDEFAYNHAQEAYVAWAKNVTASDVGGRQVTGTVVQVACPVDIDVVDADGNIFGQTRNNIVTKTTPDQADVFVIGDEKFVYMPQDKGFKISIRGTGSGVMEYSVRTIDQSTGETLGQKQFSNVAISEGKLFFTEVGGGIATTDVGLSVTDNIGKPTFTVNQNGTETAVKQCFKLWGKTTTWDKTPLNWFLLIVCFGWIWMAF
jgi:hypothetical protein